MAPPIKVNREASETLYQQIASQIRNQIRTGALPIGAKLPAIRPMATKLGVTRLTVQTAYDELRAEGWIETVVGKGTFIAKSAQPEELMQEVGRSAEPDSVLDDLTRLDEISIVRSLAQAEPDPELFPVGEFWGAMSRLRTAAHELMRYKLAQGDAKLRCSLAGLLRDRGIEAMPDDIVVTTGAIQGLSLVVQALTRQGDFVVVEQPTHLGILHTLESHHLKPLPVPVDENGPNIESLERLIKQFSPRFFLTAPNFQNPTGYQMSEQRRADLLDLAERWGLMIVEDDSRGLLSYDGSLKPALKAGDQHESVIYLNSMSKVLMPGLRVGYVVAPRPTHDELLSIKRAVDYCGPAMTQRALADFIDDGALRRHLQRVVPIYRARRDKLLQTLSSVMPKDVHWTHAKGGFSTWLTLPREVDAMDVHRVALRMGFAFTPGDAFLTEHGRHDHDHLRICFANQPEQVITEAVDVLANVIDGHY